MAPQTEMTLNTEQRILEAAKQVFLQKGMNGTAMQHIADEAEISRTSLHYYYRSKKKLYEAVLQALIGRFMTQVNAIMTQELPFPEKLKLFVHEYIDLFKANPFLPNFILNELNKNPDKIILLLSGALYPDLRDRITKELLHDNPDVSASQFMMNLISMCVFPFVARPLVQHFFFEGKEDAFENFIEERKTIVFDMLMNAIYPNGISISVEPAG